jgi:integrase
MASLQARHSRSCALRRPWTTSAEATTERGCTCRPLYHIVQRDEVTCAGRNGCNGRGVTPDGTKHERCAGTGRYLKLVREPVGHNRRDAERALNGRNVDVDRGVYRPVADVRFDEWAEKWLAGFTGKANSGRVYATTIAYAVRVFGRTKVRDVRASDVRRFRDEIRATNEARTRKNAKGETVPAPRETSPATLAKHLRQLGACFEAAIAEGYATENPVRRLHKTARPRVQKQRPAYYTDAELARLWPELAERPLYLALCRLAVATGMRFGELAALRWSDVDLLNREIHVSRTFTLGIGETPPKSGEARTVDLTPQAATVLEDWYRESGGGDGLVYEREHGGHLTNWDPLKVLYAALERAGVPRIGERGRKRDFHSFRHSFARIALESGAEITWVQKQLGHSSITLTVDTYGAWARSAEKSQAERLAGVFPL